MPEILEVEAYRRAAERVVGRSIARVVAPDSWYVKGATSPSGVRRALTGTAVNAVRRTGKMLFLDNDRGLVLGLRFGMTGRLIVDEMAVIEGLEYGPRREESSWNRFTLHFVDGGTLRVNDPRRLGGVMLDPDETALGPDALTLSRRELEAALTASAAPVKARLMDQTRIAGLGNLLVDEILWRAGIDPIRPAASLEKGEVTRLHRHIIKTLGELMARGGSHTGDLQSERERDGHCPRDGAPLLRRTVGGRTTYSCPVHQR